MVFKMYDARPLVCKASALRFEAGDEEGLRKHMDYLFRRNRRGKVKGGAPPSRRWFQGVDSWVSLIERFDREDDEHVVSVFDAAGPPGGKADESRAAAAAATAARRGSGEKRRGAAGRMLPVRRGDPALLGRGERGGARRRQRLTAAGALLGMRRRSG